MKTIGRVMKPFSAHHLITLYIYTHFKKISPRVSELFSGHILKFTKEHHSIKNVGGVMILILCTLTDNALYLSQVLRKYLKGSLS